MVEVEAGHSDDFGALDVDLHVVHEQALGDVKTHTFGGGRVAEGMRFADPEGYHVDDVLEQVGVGPRIPPSVPQPLA